MIVYLSMMLLSTLCAAIAARLYRHACPNGAVPQKTRGVQRWEVFAFLAILPFFLVAAVRFKVGTDYTVYLKPKSYIGSVFLDKPKRMEPFFRLCAEIAKLTDNKQVAFALVALVFTVFTFLFVYEQSDDWVFSVPLILLTGTFSQSLNIMRQMTAVMICLYGIKYIEQRKLKQYVICVLCAAGFHAMAVLFLVFYFAYGRELLNRFKPEKILLFIVCCYVFATVGYQAVYALLKMIGSIYVKYFGSKRDTGSSTVMQALNLLVMGGCLLLNKRKDPKMLLLLDYQFLVCIMLALNLPSSNRLAYLFMPVQIVLLPNLVYQFRDPILRRILKIGLLTLYSAFWLYYFYHLNISETFPYQTIFH